MDTSRKSLKIHFVGFNEREQYDDWLDYHYDTKAALYNSSIVYSKGTST